MDWKNELSIQIGERLKALREDKGLTQQKVADALHVKREAINMWENGFRDLKTGSLIALADFFEVSTDYLLGRTDCKSQDIDEQAICKKTGLSPAAVHRLIGIQNRDRYSINDDYLDQRIIPNWVYLAFQEYISSIITSSVADDIAICCCKRAALDVDLYHDYRLNLEYETLKKDVVKDYPHAARWIASPNERLLLYNSEIARFLEEEAKSLTHKMKELASVKEYLSEELGHAET